MMIHKHYDDFSDNEERSTYLRNRHQVMADRLFKAHEIRHCEDDAVGSFVYTKGRTFWFETYFDDHGQTCHRIFDLNDAIELVEGISWSHANLSSYLH